MELGRVLGRMPQQLILYAIEVADVSIGLGLSAPVAAAVPALVDAVLRELGRTDAGQLRATEAGSAALACSCETTTA